MRFVLRAERRNRTYGVSRQKLFSCLSVCGSLYTFAERNEKNMKLNGRYLGVKELTVTLLAVAVLVLVAVVWYNQGQSSCETDVDDGVESVSSVNATFKSTGNAVIDSLVGNMVFVEGGTFMMGATPEQGTDACDNEKPVHRVTVGSFMISKYEVTQREWETVMGSNPSCSVGGNLPVEYVNWDDCQSFIKKLNSMTDMDFRLPTEVEWEYAVRGGNKSKGYKYSGGDNVDDVAWYGGNHRMNTHVVGGKLPNELGLYDMSGNVYEWCEELYRNYEGAPIANPMVDSLRSDRVIRGGSFFNGSEYCRVSDRRGLAHDFRSFDLGLRLAASVPLLKQKSDAH